MEETIVLEEISIFEINFEIIVRNQKKIKIKFRNNNNFLETTFLSSDIIDTSELKHILTVFHERLSTQENIILNNLRGVN